MDITIRRSTTDDAEAFARIMGDPDVLPGLMQMPYTSAEIWRARLAENNAPGKTDLSLCAVVQGEVVGNAGLHPIGPALRRRHAMHLGIAVAKTYQGRGVGSALMAALCDYADDWAQVLRLELTVYTDNAVAIGLYKKFGFVIEGTLRGYGFRNGRYIDTYTMARLHPRLQAELAAPAA
jgi:L-phenylalanine/L-methionine N-acetyltransferase